MGYHYRSKCLTTHENSLATPLHFLTMQNQDRSQSATNPEFPALVSVGGRDLALQTESAMSTQYDLTRPPPHRGPTKLERLMPHLPRIEKALRLGWRMAAIKEALAVELELGEVSVDTFKKMVARARRRAAAAKDATTELGAAVVEPVPVCDLTQPPPYQKPTKLERLLPHLERIDQARRLGWRMADIQAKLTAELDLGEMSANTFSVLVSSARRRVAA